MPSTSTAGLAGATDLVHRLFDDMIDDAARLGAGLDWKTSLQELTASQLLGVPYYEVTESGPDHEKTFEAGVRLGGTVFGTGSGRSKKEAEQQAAEEAWNRIRQADRGDAHRRRRFARRGRGLTRRRRRRRPPRRGRLAPADRPVPELPEVETVRRGLERMGGRPPRSAPSRYCIRARSGVTCLVLRDSQMR